MKAIILCAGKGERLRPLTETTPKPMIPIAGRPVLEYIITLCKKHGIKEIGINTSYLPEKIKEYFGNGEKFDVKLVYSFEQELLGTSGAMNNFRAFLESDEPFFVIYGDNVTDLDLGKMMEFHKSMKGQGTIYVYKEEMVDKETGVGYVLVGEDNKIKKIVEKPTKEEEEKLKKTPEKEKFMNAGVYILEPSVFDLIPEGYSDFAKNILPKILEKSLYGFRSECYFKEVGQMQRYLKAKRDIESGSVALP